MAEPTDRDARAVLVDWKEQLVSRAQTIAQMLAAVNHDVEVLTASLYDPDGVYLGTQTFGVRGEEAATKLFWTPNTPNAAVDIRLTMQLTAVDVGVMRASANVWVDPRYNRPTSRV